MQILMILLIFTCVVALYFFVPRKKIFLSFCLTIFLASGIFFLFTRQKDIPVKKEEEVFLLAKEQTLFNPFFTQYQKHLEQIGYNNQTLHDIVDNFSADLISIETVRERLTLLLKNEEQVEKSLSHLEVPYELSLENQKLAKNLLDKTLTYAKEGKSATQKILDLTNKIYEENLSHEVESEKLMLLLEQEAPIALFTADILMALKKNLAPLTP